MYSELERIVSAVEVMENVFCIRNKNGKILLVSLGFENVIKNSKLEDGYYIYDDKCYIQSRQEIKTKTDFFYLETLTDITKLYNKLNTLKEENKNLKIDSVTSLPTRRELDLHINKMDIKNNIVVMCDIDDFKFINNNYGHQMGDQILNIFGKNLKESIRDEDFVGRYGGEEFIFKTDNINTVLKRLNEIRENLENRLNCNDVPLITFSTGIAICKDNDEIKSIINLADRALYFIKNNGKNANGIYDRDTHRCMLIDKSRQKTLSKI